MENIKLQSPASVLNTETVAAVNQFLQPVIVELTAIAVNAKQLHWHVRGASFSPVHELLDTLVEHARDWADLAAERVVALGLPVDGTLQTVAKDSKTPKVIQGFAETKSIISQAIDQIDAALKVVHEAVVELGSIDASSQDVAIEIERGLDKDRWFFYAQIAAA